MKVRNIVLPFIMLVTFVFTLGSIIPSAHAHSHNEGNEAIEHSHATLNDVHEHEGEEAELSNLEPNDEVKERSIICCVPGSPKEVTSMRYHLKQSATSCVLVGQNITKCLNCGAITPGQQVQLNTHNPQTTPDCPF